MADKWWLKNEKIPLFFKFDIFLWQESCDSGAMKSMQYQCHIALGIWTKFVGVFFYYDSTTSHECKDKRNDKILIVSYILAVKIIIFVLINFVDNNTLIWLMKLQVANFCLKNMDIK